MSVVTLFSPFRFTIGFPTRVFSMTRSCLLCTYHDYHSTHFSHILESGEIMLQASNFPTALMIRQDERTGMRNLKKFVRFGLLTTANDPTRIVVCSLQ